MRRGREGEGGSPKIEEREEKGRKEYQEGGTEKRGVPIGEKRRRREFERKEKKRTLHLAPGESKGNGGAPKGGGKGQGANNT